MGGAASILFWCAAVRRPQAWSARRSGALVWGRPSAATPAGAGGWGRWGARCAGPAAPPPPPSRSLLGEGGRLLGSGGAEDRSCGPQAGGGERGGGWGGRPTTPRRPAPSGVGLPSVVSGVPPWGILVPWGLPGGRGRRARPGRPPMGQCGGGGGGGDPPALVRAPVFPRPALRRGRSVCAVLGATGPPSAGSRQGGGVRAVHRGRLPRRRCPLTPGAAASSGGLRGRRLSGLPPSALGPEEEGGGGWGGPSGPLVPPPDGRGGAAWQSRPQGPAVGWGVALFSRPPLPRVGPSCRPSLGPLVPPAVVVRRWPAGGGHEG